MRRQDGLRQVEKMTGTEVKVRNRSDLPATVIDCDLDHERPDANL
jgi:hypothetical protein